ncbi:MAG: hypothetical protein AAF945_00010 [Actinomycetota bacterium]
MAIPIEPGQIWRDDDGALLLIGSRHDEYEIWTVRDPTNDDPLVMSAMTGTEIRAGRRLLRDAPPGWT